MSTVDELKVRYVVEARVLGQDKEARKRGREKEYAIQVTLSDESQYTMFRTLKDIAVLQSRLISRFPVESGYFKKSERVIPDCPVKQTIFGVQRAISDDRSFEKLLNSYIKEIPGLPASIVKCDLVSEFFSLRATDIQVPGSPKSNKKKGGRGKKSNQVIATRDSKISGPVSLRSYYAVADYSDKKTKFNIAEGAVVQVMQKDPAGWWMVDNGGSIGWAPASFLVPVDPEDLQNEAEENEQLIEPEKVGARYISISTYQASREDELSFVRGAVVKVIKKYVDGWWLVRYNGGEGYVPGALFKRFDKRQATVYVKKIRRNFISRKSTRIVPTIKPKWLGQNARTTRRNGPPKETKPTLALYQCKAIFQGAPERFELTVNKGDSVKVLDKKDHGWWYVEDQHGRSGWVPATYLRPILDTGDGRLAGGDKIVGTVRKVLQSHKAGREDELSVRKGESVEVLMVSEDGWWAVRNANTQKQGLVPSICLTQETGMNDVIEEEEGESPDPLQSRSEPLLRTSDEMVSELSSNSTSVMDKWEEDPAALDDIDEAGDEMDLDGCYVATSDYTKQAMDEIDLYEGQVVCVIDDSDQDVWYVNCDGKEGWVPSDILKEFEDDVFPASSGESTPDTQLSSNLVSSESDEDSRPIRPRSGAFSPVSPIHSPSLSRKEAFRTTSVDPPPFSNGAPYTKHHLKTSPAVHRRISPESSHSSGVSSSSAASSVTIMVENKSLAELEREVAQAERKVQEARELAKQLKEQVRYVRSHSNEGRTPSPY